MLASADVLSVRGFFESVCPKLLSLQAEAAKKLGGTLTFRVFGDDGGAWCVDLDAASVATTIAPEADLLLELQSEDFIHLLRGTLDIPAAVQMGRIRYVGDTSMLVKFGALLEVAG